MIKKQGEVYRVEIIDAQGYKQKGDDDGKRLVVVVSNNQQNAKKNVIVIAPLSSKVKKIYPFQVPIFFQGKLGKAKCEQVRAITIERFEERLGELTEKEMNEIKEREQNFKTCRKVVSLWTNQEGEFLI